MKEKLYRENACPECGHQFRGNGFDGIDAHWRSKHESVMPYSEAWPLIKSGNYFRQPPVYWLEEFQKRMSSFARRTPQGSTANAVSIKFRVTSGCFHLEHSPHAYELIYRHRHNFSADVEFVEHESGPELLVYLTLGASGITLAANVIQLITAIIQSRSDGARRGDRPAEPVELIIRRVNERNKFHEEFVLRVGHREPQDRTEVEMKIHEALRRLFKDSGSKG
jgi:hypothetical protein